MGTDIAGKETKKVFYSAREGAEKENTRANQEGH